MPTTKRRTRFLEKFPAKDADGNKYDLFVYLEQMCIKDMTGAKKCFPLLKHIRTATNRPVERISDDEYLIIGENVKLTRVNTKLGGVDESTLE